MQLNKELFVGKKEEGAFADNFTIIKVSKQLKYIKLGIRKRKLWKML